MVRNFKENQPVMLKAASRPEDAEIRSPARPAPRPASRFPAAAMTFAAILSALCVGRLSLGLFRAAGFGGARSAADGAVHRRHGAAAFSVSRHRHGAGARQQD